MKKFCIILLLFFFVSFVPVHAETENTQSESLFQEVIKTFFPQGSGDNSSPSNNSNVNPVVQDSTPTNNFPVTDPLPLLNNQGLTYSATLIASVRVCLSNKSTYEEASKQTGIPWQILAGIHSKEGNCGSNQSLVSGRKIGAAEPDIGINCSSLVGGVGKPKVVAGGCGFASLLDSAIYAGNHLKGKIGKIPTTQQELAQALSRYNGGGNSNCRGGTLYKYCPPTFEGEDDTYVFNKNPDGKHEIMYLRYCADGVKCNPPKVYAGIGVLTAAGIIDSISKL